MAQSLIFLESQNARTGLGAEAARRLGFEPVFVECSTARVEDVMRALEGRAVRNVAGVMTFAECCSVTALALSWRLGVNGMDPAVIRLKDRGALADLLPEFTPPTLRFHRDFIPADKISRLLAVYGKLLLKPTQTTGKLGYFTVTDVSEVPPGLSRAGLPAGLDDGTWVAQVFCEGRHARVAGFAQNARLRVLLEDDGLSDEQRRLCDVALEHLLRRSEFRNGYFHAEFVIEDQEPSLVEANVGSAGGEAILEKVASKLDLDPVEVYMHVILNSLFPERAAGLNLSDAGFALPGRDSLRG